MDDNIPELSARSRKIMMTAKRLAQTYLHDFVTTEHILLSILEAPNPCDGVQIMSTMNIDVIEFKSFIMTSLGKYKGDRRPVLSDIEPSGRVLKVMSYASCIAQEMKRLAVDVDHILMSILVSDSGTGNNLFKLKNIDVDDLYEIIYSSIAPRIDKTRRKLQKAGTGTGGDVSKTSKTKESVLAKYAVNLTQQAAVGDLDPVIGREHEVDGMIQILSRRTKNNPVLIGEAGVGKTAVVEALSLRIINNEVPEGLMDKEIHTLDLAALVAGTIYRGQFEERLKDVISYVQDRENIILFVDELHMLAGAGSSTGAMDASNILKPALARGKLSCIGATTTQEYKEYIECDGALERRFQSIYVDEPDVDDTYLILKGIKHKYESYHNVTYSNIVLREIVSLCDRYAVEKNFPDKAIDILDEVGARKKVSNSLVGDIGFINDELGRLEKAKDEAVASKLFDEAVTLRREEEALLNDKSDMTAALKLRTVGRAQKVTLTDVYDIISDKCNVPVASLEEDEADVLSKLSNKIQRKVIGQQTGVDKICNAIKRSKAGISDPEKPICSLMFLGPTGVGKTHLARILGDTVFNNNNFKQFDMSEYSEQHSVSKLIGSPPGYIGYGDGGKLTEYVRHQPYCVLLFDEIEKSHPDIMQTFLQILEYGTLTDSDGLEVNFKNTIIIMTSNIGAHTFEKRGSVGFGDVCSREEGVLTELRKVYPPEFLNRFDELVTFEKLREEDLLKILKILIDNTKKTLKSNNKTSLHIDPPIYEHLLSIAEDIDRYGARPLKRLITQHIETPLADYIINNNLSKAKKLYVMLDDDNTISFHS